MKFMENSKKITRTVSGNEESNTPVKEAGTDENGTDPKETDAEETDIKDTPAEETEEEAGTKEADDKTGEEETETKTTLSPDAGRAEAEAETPADFESLTLSDGTNALDYMAATTTCIGFGIFFLTGLLLAKITWGRLR